MRCTYTNKFLKGEFKCERERIENKNYCIFHDENYWKDSPDDYAETFKDVIEREVIQQGYSRMIGYHIPKFSFMDMNTNRELYFDHAIFHDLVYFSGTTFTAQVSFSNATFEKEASFLNSVFLPKVHFRQAAFKDKSYFDGALFSDGVNFYETMFEKESVFRNTVFRNEVFFPKAEFKEEVNFVGALFTGKTDFSNTKIHKADFSQADFAEEADFFFSHFQSFSNNDGSKYEIPIKFDYATFRKRVRFSGRPNSKLNLETVSFKGVDLSNAEFHNVNWLEAGFPTFRRMVVDEKILHLNKNYEEVTKI